MSIQWTFIAGYLYFEVLVVIILILPLFSARKWHYFFKSRLFAIFRKYALTYFYVLLGVLSLFLLDAIREMRKYSHASDGYVHLSSELKGNVKLFRAQRNFYITGFSIFLAFVIRRLVKMLITQDELSHKAEAIIKEAEATVKLAKTTVLASAIHADEVQTYVEMKRELKMLHQMLNEEKIKSEELEEEAMKWKLKYEEAVAALNGKGDE